VRPPPRFLAATLLAACIAGPPATTEDACPITEPVLLAAAPTRWSPSVTTYYDFFADGDHILYTFDPPTAGGRTYWHKRRCGGEPERFPSLLPGLHHPFTIDTPDGPVLYARDTDGRTFVVDRLDDPAADVPRPVLDLPLAASLLYYKTGRRYAYFSETTREHEQIQRAAAVGGTTFAYYTHTGDPEVPAAFVGYSLVQASLLDDHLLVLDDAGTLRRFDPFTADDAELLTGVRHYTLSPDRTRLIWQAIGDDLAEPVNLRDLAAGTDTPIAVNELAAASWGRAEDDDDGGPPGDDANIGAWIFTFDGAVAAMLGEGNALVAAVRTDTGAALPIPDHLSFKRAFDHALLLELPDPADHVHALWDPLTGDLREVYRGLSEPLPLFFADDRLTYTLFDPDDAQRKSLWRLDLATGQATELIPELSGNVGKIDDHRYLLRDTGDYLDLPPIGDNELNAGVNDLSIFDADTGQRHPLARGVTGFAIVPGEGLVYLDVHGPQPGLRALPFPE
jgi:hypothetical protein